MTCRQILQKQETTEILYKLSLPYTVHISVTIISKHKVHLLRDFVSLCGWALSRHLFSQILQSKIFTSPLSSGMWPVQKSLPATVFNTSSTNENRIPTVFFCKPSLEFRVTRLDIKFLMWPGIIGWQICWPLSVAMKYGRMGMPPFLGCGENNSCSWQQFETGSLCGVWHSLWTLPRDLLISCKTNSVTTVVHNKKE